MAIRHERTSEAEIFGVGIDFCSVNVHVHINMAGWSVPNGGFVFYRIRIKKYISYHVIDPFV